MILNLGAMGSQKAGNCTSQLIGPLEGNYCDVGWSALDLSTQRFISTSQVQDRQPPKACQSKFLPGTNAAAFVTEDN